MDNMETEKKVGDDIRAYSQQFVHKDEGRAILHNVPCLALLKVVCYFTPLSFASLHPKPQSLGE
jgi:hypothetical protein